LRLSGCVFRGTEAVSGAFFTNPIELQPAAARMIFVEPAFGRFSSFKEV
jgi:hypothetical protein